MLGRVAAENPADTIFRRADRGVSLVLTTRTRRLPRYRHSDIARDIIKLDLCRA